VMYPVFVALGLALLVAVVFTPGVLAVWLQGRVWWARATRDWPGGRSGLDGPGRLLAAAAATLPPERHDWGRAMTAEIAQIPDRAARWRFALGGARVAAAPPRSGRAPVLTAAAGTALAAVAAGIGAGTALPGSPALPGLRVFAVAFVTLAGALVMLTVARHPRVRPAAAGLGVAAAGLAGVAGCVAVTVYFLVRHPSSVVDLGPGKMVVLAVVLAVCLWLALLPPAGLASSRRAWRVGMTAAVVLGVVFLLGSRLPSDRDNGVLGFVLLAPAVVGFAGAMVAATAGRSFRVGVQAAVWAALLGGLLVGVLALPEAWHWYATDTRLLLDGEVGAAFGRNAATLLWLLVWVLVSGGSHGVIGAAVGSAGARMLPRRHGRGGRGRSGGSAARFAVEVCLALLAVGFVLAFLLGDQPPGQVIPKVDHAVIGGVMLLVGLVAGPISLLLCSRRDLPGRRATTQQSPPAR
jgi:hypothetical protein